MKYKAFISYRHADNSQEGRRWAEWLHRGLERYSVPPDLVGQLNQRSVVIPDSLYPIFRDEDELPADADLASGIRRALEQSDCLIVLCSPRSSQSPWVRKEVREFKELGRSDRILAVIISGEPNADDPSKAREGVFPEEECFPFELRHGVALEDDKNEKGHPRIDWEARTEPLAADLRPQGRRAEGFTSVEAYKDHLKLNSSFDSERIDELGKSYGEQLERCRLKVIAGVLGISLSQLEDRDARYRAEVAERKAEQQQQIAKRLAKRNRFLVIGSVIVLLLSAVSGVLWNRSNQALSVADQERDSAIAAREASEEARLKAESAEEKARGLLVKASFSDRFIAQDKMLKGEVQDALAYLARACVNDPKGSFAAEQAAVALNYLKHPIPSLVLLGHKEMLVSASFSPDGSRIVSASGRSTFTSSSGDAIIWDAKTGKVLVTLLDGEGSALRNAVFSPGGSLVAVSSDGGTLGLVNAETGEFVKGWQGDFSSLNSKVSFDSKGKRLIFPESDGKIRVFEISEKDKVIEFQGHADNVNGAVFSPGGDFFVSISDDKTARLWSVENGLLFVLSGHEDKVTSVNYSKNGKFVVTASWDKTARIWNTENGESVAVLSGHSLWVNSAEFSPDSSQVTTASKDGTSRIWNAETGELIVTLSGHEDDVNRALYSPDGALIATASDDRTARIWDSITGELLATLSGHDDSVTDVQFNPMGNQIVTASSDGGVRVWDLDLLLKLRRSIPKEGVKRFSSVAFSPDESVIAIGKRDGAIEVYDTAQYNLIKVFNGHDKEVNFIAFSPIGDRLISGSWDKLAKVWDFDSGEVRQKRAFVEPVFEVAYVADGARAVIVGDNQITIVDAENIGTLETYGIEGNSYHPLISALSFDERFVALGSSTSKLRVLNRNGGTVEFEVDQPVSDVTFSADSRYLLVSYDWTKQANVWDLSSGSLKYSLNGHRRGIAASGFSRDGDFIVTCSRDHLVKIWDVASGELLRTLSGHPSAVLDFSLNQDGKRLATLSEDGTIILWSVPLGIEIARIRSKYYGDFTGGIVRFSPRGQFLAVDSFKKSSPWLLRLLPNGAGPPPGWFAGFLEFIAQTRVSSYGEVQRIRTREWLTMRDELRAVLASNGEEKSFYIDLLRNYVH